MVERCQCAENASAGMVMRIETAVLDVAQQLAHPAPKDYPKEVETWFRGKRWSVPFWLLLVGLPALVGYIIMIRFVLQWLRIPE